MLTSVTFINNKLFSLECGMNVHHKCQKKVANLCGINQKLLAEALTQVSQVRLVNHFTVPLHVHLNL